MSNTIFASNDSIVDLQQYGAMDSAKVVISGTDFKFIFPGNVVVNVINGALYSSLENNHVHFKFQGQDVSGQQLLKTIDLSNLQLERLDSALSDQRQDRVLKDNINKISEINAKDLEEAKKEAADLKHEAEKMRAEAEEAQKASAEVQKQLEEFLNDKAQSNGQNGAASQNQGEEQLDASLYHKKYDDDSVAEASRLVFSDYSSSSSSSSSSSESDETPIDVKPIDVALKLDDGSDSGVKNDNITNVTTPQFVGSTDPGLTVSLRIDGVVVAVTTSDAMGNFSFNSGTVLADGQHNVQVDVTDGQGGSGSAKIIVTIDTVIAAPTFELDDQYAIPAADRIEGENLTRFTDAKIIGEAEAGSQVAIYANGVLLTTVTVDSDGAWSYQFSGSELNEGINNIEIDATDKAGNTASTTGVITLDTIPPETPVIILDESSDTGMSSTDSLTNDKTPSLHGNAEPNSTLELYLNGYKVADISVDSMGNWQYTLPENKITADGIYTFEVVSSDRAGNTSTAQIDVTVDTDIDAFTLAMASQSDSGVAGDNYTNDIYPAFTGKTDPNSHIVITNLTTGEKIEIDASQSGNFSFNLAQASAEGLNELSITVTDYAGNQQTFSYEYTIDTVAPVSPDIELDKYTVSKSGDILTNDATPAFTGTAEAGSTVTIYIDGKACGTVTANHDGIWSFTLPSDLADGSYTAVAYATDLAGNVSPSSADCTFTVDTSTTSPVAMLQAEDDTGISQTDWITRQNDNLTIDGTAEKYATITVMVDGKAVGTTQADANGNWQFEYDPNPALSDGDYTLTIQAQDEVGNTSSSSYDLVIDTVTVTPSLKLDTGSDTGSSNDDGITKETQPLLTGTAEANATIEIFIDGTVVGQVVSDKNGVWNYRITEEASLADGEHAVVVRATDAAGNSANSTTLDIVVDSTMETPTIHLDSDSGISDADRITNNASPIFSGSAEAYSSITIYQDGKAIGKVSADANGNWSYSFTGSQALTDGSYIFYITATDVAGNSATSEKIQVTIDTQVSIPTLDLADASDTGSLNSDNITRDTTPTFSLGNIDADVISVQVIINGTAYDAVQSEGKWTFTAPELADGDYSISVIVTDNAGNTANSTTLAMTVDTSVAAPVIALSDDTGTPGDNQTNDTTPGFAIATDNDAVSVMVSIDGGTPVAATKDADGQWHIDSAALADGDHSIVATVTDLAGNTATSSLAFTVDTMLSVPTIDLTDASDSGSLNSDNITNDTMPAFTLGSIDADVTKVQVLINDTAYDVVQSEGKWTFTAPELADGTYSVTVQVTDDAGNVQTSTALAVTVDTTVAAPVIALSDDTGTAGDNQTNDATPGFAIATDNDAISVMVSIDGGTPVAATKAADGQWHIDSTALADGDHTIVATVTDLAGNTATSSLAFTVDTTLSVPTIDLADASDSGSSNSDNITRDTTPAFTLGSIDADVISVQVLINGTAYPATLTDGTWTFTAPELADGDYSVTVQVTDDAGNVQTSTALAVTVDTRVAAPVIALSDDTGTAGDNQTNDATPGFTVSTDPDAFSVMVSIDGGKPLAATKDADGQWHIDSTALADGDHTIVATVTDLAGNTATSSLAFTVDTTLSVPTIDLADASDSGSLNSDNITNDTTPAFTLGSIDADVTKVQVIINGTAYDAVKAEGKWTFTAPELADGDYSVTVQVTDDAGNVQTSTALAMTVDTRVAAPVIALSDDTGTPGDNQTNDTTPGFTITTENDAVSVMVSIDGGKPVAATKDADGQWHIDSTALADGDHTIVATVTDLAGNTATSSLTFTVDTTLSVPTIDLADASDSGSLNSDNITNDTTPAFTLGSIDADVTKVQVIINGTAYDAVKAEGKWTFTAPELADGDYSVTVQLTDDAGNVQTSTALAVTVDTRVAAPVIALSDDTGTAGDNQTRDATPGFTVSTDPDAFSVMVSIDGGTPVAATKTADGQWHIDSTALADGDHTIVATVTDLAGNTADSAALTFTVDTTLSVPTIDLADASDSGSLNSDNITNDTTPAFTLGSIDADVTKVQVIINGTAYDAVKAEGKWTFTAPELADGDYSVTVQVTDDAGNVQTSTALAITVDTRVAAPVIALSDDTGTPGDNQTNDATPGFAITTENDAVSVMVSIDGGTPVAATKAADGQWHIDSTALADGDHSIVATVTDLAGNTADSATLTFTVDTTLSVPTIDLADASDSGSSNSDNITNDTTPAFTLGSIDADVTKVQVIINGTAYDAVQSEGKWTFTAPELADGDYSVTVQVTDDAGNVQTSTALAVTVDTRVAVPVIALSDDTGTPGDNQTNDTTPGFTITTENDAVSVMVSIDGGKPVAATKDADGQWHIDSTALADGDHTIVATVTDLAGNTADSAALTFTVDTTLSVPTIDLADASDSGSLNSDNITNDTTPAFTLGSIDADVTKVQVIINGTAYDAVQSEGKWTFTAPELADGDYSVTVQVTDDAGNVQTSTALAVTVDTSLAAPVIALSDDTGTAGDNQTNDTTPGFAIATDNNAVSVMVSIDGGTPVAATKDADGQWHIDSSALADGDHTIVATVTDLAGNTATSSLTFTVDTTLSVPTIDLADASDSGSNSDNITRDTTPAFTLGSIDADVTKVQVLINGTAYDAVQSEGKWTFTAPELADGDYSVTVQVTDDAGNVQTSTALAVTVDTTVAAPVIALSDDTGTAGDNQTNDATPGFTVSTDPDAFSVMVSIDGGKPVAATKTADGQWHIDSTALADGDHTIVATVTDLAGNTADSATLTFTVDTTLSVPTIDLMDASDSGSSNSDNITRDTTPAFTLGNIDADVISVQVLINGTAYPATLTDGTWTFTAPELADGDYSVTVQVTDDAGNVQTSTALAVTVDTSVAAPVIALSDDTGTPGDNQTRDATPGFTVSTDPDAFSVMVSIDGGTPVAATKAADGQWHIDSTALADGDHTIVATVTDLAGNTATSSLTFTVDTTLSVPTIDLADASDSGSLNSDNITRDTTPAFTLGSIDADVTKVQIIINGTAYDAVKAEGKWTFTAPELADGDYSITVQVTDDAGNVQTSTALAITVDTSVAAPVIALSDDTGTAGDNQTNDATPGFTITTENDAVSVMVSIDGGKPVAATKAADGQWHIDSAALADGDHTIVATVTDLAGNTADSAILTFTVDTTLSVPTIDLADASDSGSLNSDNITNDTTPAFTLGNIDADVTKVQVLINGTAYDAVKAEGKWTFTAPELADGDYSISVQVTDDAGNTATSAALAITVDTEVLPVNIVLDKTSDTGESSTDNYTADTTPTFKFSNIPDDVATITLTLSTGQHYTIDLSKSTSFTLPDELQDGSYTATVTVTDVAGNSADSKISFTIDTIVDKPTVELATVSDSGDSQTDGLTNETKPQFQISGVDTDDVNTITIAIVSSDGSYKDSWTLDSETYESGAWACSVALDDGQYTITVTVEDMAGNQSTSDAARFEIDTVTHIDSIVLLDDTGSSTTDNQTNVNTPEFAIGVPDDVTHVSIMIDGKAAGEASKQTDGKWHFSTAVLADGAHTVSVTVTDEAGNTSNKDLNFTVDTTLSVPTLQLSSDSDTGHSDSDNVTQDVRPTFVIGNIDSDVVSVSLTINGQTWPITVENGSATFTVPADLPDGVWQAQLTVVDDAGNEKTTSLSVTIDTSTSVDGITLQSDTGVQNDWMTNDSTPTFAITAPADAHAVTVSIGSLTQDAIFQEGKWVVTLPSALADGEYTLTVTVTDDAGNTANRAQTFTIDTTLEPLTVKMMAADDSGVVGDNVTNDTKPTFELGNVPADVYSIEVTLNGATTTIKKQADGSWTYTPETALVEGKYTLDVRVTDEAGNQRTSTYDFTVDTSVDINSITLTTDTGDSSSDGITNAAQPIFNVTTSDDVVSLTATINGLACTVVKNANGDWTVTSPILSVAGDYTLTVTVEDAAGNTTSDTKTITFDNQLSVPTIAFDAGDDTGYDATDHLTSNNKPTFLISNMDSDVTHAVITLDGVPITLTQDGSGNWSFTPPSALSDGNHKMILEVQDRAGNTSTQTFSFTVDTTLSTPTIDLSSSSDSGDSDDDNLTSKTQPEFVINNVDSDIYSVIVTLNGVDYDVTKNADGEWVFQAPKLADGDYTITVTATDKAGNERTSDLDFTIDTTVAIDQITMSDDTGFSSDDHLTNDTIPSFDISVAADVTHVSVALDGGDAQTLTKTNGKWTYTASSALSDGEHSIVVNVMDKAGNTTQETFTFTIDTTLTPVTVDLKDEDDSGSSSADNYTNNTQPTFEFGSLDKDVYSLTVNLNGKDIPVDLTSQPVSFTPDEALADGTYILIATVTDNAGNTKETPLTFTIDTQTSVSVDFVVGDDTGYSDSDNITKSNAPEFEISVPADVESVSVTLNGTVTSLTKDESGRWIYSAPALADGNYTLDVSVVDKAGNTASTELKFVVDTTLSTPTIDLAAASDTGTLSNDHLTNDTTPYFTLDNIDSDAYSVTVTINNKTYNATEKNGVWGLQLPDADALPDGTYTATVKVEDDAGNTKSSSMSFTVDTICSAPVLALDNGSNSGSTDDNITNVTKPVISISGVPADIASITVTLGDTTLSLDPSTTSWQVPQSLADGAYSVVVTFTDNAGNSASTTYNFTVDTVVDSPAVLLLDDTGQNTTDNLTNVSVPRIQISAAEELTSVTVTLNGHTQTLEKNAQGEWIYTADMLADGTYTATVEMVDVAGNHQTETLTFTIDTQIPQPTISMDSASDSGDSSSDSLTNDTQPTFIVSGVPDDVDTVFVVINGAKYTATQNEAGEWTVTSANLADGNYTAEVTVTDKAGNTAESSMNFTIDTHVALSVELLASSDTGSSQTDKITKDTSPTFGGLTDKDATLVVTVLDESGNAIQTQTISPASDGTWSITLGDLTDGNYTISVTATDKAGNTQASNIDFVIDTVVNAPGVALSESDPGNNHEALSLAPEFSGTAEAGSTLVISIDGVTVASVVADSNGTWSWTPPSAINSGDHIISVVATDKAGNVSDATNFAFIIPLIDVDPPTLQLQTASDSGSIGDFVTNDTTPSITGTSLPGSTVTIYVNCEVVGTAATDSTGRYNFNLPEMAEGTYSIEVSVINPNNGEEVKSDPASLVIDTHVVPLDWDINGLNDEGYLNTNTPVVSGISEAGAHIKVMIDGRVVVETVAASDGKWLASITNIGADGEHEISFSVTDVAGNTETFGPESFVLDTYIAPLTVDLRDTDDTGTSDTDNITQKTSVHLDGTAEAGSTVTIANTQGEILATIAVESDGAWSTEITLQEGMQTFVVTSTDAAGNTVSKNIDITRDTQNSITDVVLSRDSNSADTLDAITKVTTPTLTAVTNPNATVDVYVNGEKVATVTADAAGTVSWTMPESADGSYDIKMVSTDAAGNTATSATTTVVIDTVVDNFSVDTLPDLTNSKALSVTGTGESGATITVYLNGVAAGQVTVAADGSWTVPLILNDDGEYSLTVQITDVAGNSQTSDPFVFTLDSHTDYPTINLDDASNSGSLDDNITSDNTPAFHGTGEPGATISILVDEKTVATVTADDEGNWTWQYPTTLADGEYSIRVVAEDTAGNTAESARILVTVDTSTWIELDKMNPDGGLYSNDYVTARTTPTFQINGETGQPVKVYIDGKYVETITISGRNYQYTVPQALDDGSHTIRFDIADAAGNTASTGDQKFTIDTVNDTPVTLDNINGESVADHTVDGTIYINDISAGIKLSGMAEANSYVTVKINGMTVSNVWADGTGKWSVNVNPMLLSDATWTVQVSSEDRAGNDSTVSTFTIVIDTSISQFTANVQDDKDSSADKWVVNNRTPVFNGVGEAGATVTLMVAGMVVATTTVAADGTWSIKASALPEGTSNLTFTIKDTAGNTQTINHDILVDSVAPNTPTVEISSWNEEGNLWILSGKAEAGTTIVIKDESGNVITTVNVNSSGSWSTAINYPDGGKVSIQAEDSATNISVPVDLDVMFTTPAVALDVSSDGGALGDNLTNDSTPTLVLSNIEKDVVAVSVTIDGTTVQATKISDGVWTVTWGTPLSDGECDVQVSATDAAGNTATQSFSFTIDTVLSAPVIAMDAASDTSTVGDNITQTVKPTFVVTNVDADVTKVEVTLNGNTQTLTKDASGNWIYTPETPLADGNWTVEVKVTDAAGNTKQSSLDFTVDTSISTPTVALDASSDTGDVGDNLTNETTPTFILSNIDPDVTSVMVTLNGETHSATKDEQGNWTYTPETALSDGSWTLKVKVTDGAGNTAESSLDFTIDSTLSTPTVMMDTDSDTATAGDNITSDTTPTFILSNIDPDVTSVMVTLNGETHSATKDEQGNWTYTPDTPLADGSGTLVVTVTDAAGNSADASLDYTIDTTISTPTIALDAGSDSGTVGDNLTKDTTPTFILSNIDPDATSVMVTLNGETHSATKDEQGNWTYTPDTPLADGSGTLVVTVTDAAGNSTDASLDYTIDTTVSTPTVSLDADSDSGASGDNITKDDTPTFILSNIDPDATTVTVTINGETHSATQDESGHWTWTPEEALAEGTWTLVVNVSDAAGNTASQSVEFTVDTHVDNFDVTFDGTSSQEQTWQTDESTLSFSGHGEAGALVSVSLDNGDVLTANVDKDGNWNLQLEDVAQGEHQLTFTITDVAGNTSTVTHDVDVGTDDPVSLRSSLYSSEQDTRDTIEVESSHPVFEFNLDASITHASVELDGVTHPLVPSPSGPTQFDVPVALEDGPHSLVLRTQDSAGNSERQDIAFTVDTSSRSVVAGMDDTRSDESDAPHSAADQSSSHEAASFAAQVMSISQSVEDNQDDQQHHHQ
ncbi:Ig-like domain-containing protein [Citrobacter cronae]|uniref:Ig-like domain repeat protein n=14 Tax=Citrobacter TaxID=544 RepID=A0A7X1EIN6_9ENTR|nr:Ig-like domain-containing protein [Citrobacter cronae]MBC2621902.1 Ig-like domain repeat protein [Citrobacter cronae]